MEAVAGRVILKRGREKPVHNRHPWVFSGAIAQIEGKPQPGDLVQVAAAGGHPLAHGYFNSHSQIQVRLLSWDINERIDEAFWRGRLESAIRGREKLQLEPQTTAYRLVNAEADRLPGLIVDRYGSHLVIQCLTGGIDARKEQIIPLLAELLRPESIVERSDAAVRRKEGLPQAKGVVWGAEPIGPVTIYENGLPFLVDLMEGHKSGFYLDQRDNRALVGQPRFAAGAELLNVFAYTGGFASYAAVGGASRIVNIDSSAAVLELAEQNVTAAAGARPQDEYWAGDAFEILRDYRDEGKRFDMIILDPPKFAHSQRDIDRATRGYKDLNWLALQLLRPGSTLATFSCSGLVTAELFQKVVFGAAVDAGREVQILHTLQQGADHPVLLSFPESAYLKGLLCRVL